MQFSEKWLREWVDVPVNTDQLADQLTHAGLEVAAVLPATLDFDKVVVGEVLSVEKHPNADRLNVCRVSIGGDEPLEIVCGAQNVRIQLKVAVIQIGGHLGDFKIKKTKLRGVTSHGMICSASELGLAEQSSGILELPPEAPLGADFKEYFQLDDHIIDIELTPNRGDCASLRGIAREVAAINQVPLQPIEIPKLPITTDETLSIKLDAASACPRYCGRLIKNIRQDAKTPLWMLERLRRCGLRATHPVVDVTNYVMLELGQPMHAFDCTKLDGSMTVRLAKYGEKVTLLDNQTLELDTQALVIADSSKVLALAGVMGGGDSAVTEKTTDIFLESAYFTPSPIALCARRYGLHTESSYRFERGVDSELASIAIERATQLLLQVVGGEAGPVIEEQLPYCLPEIKRIMLRRAQIQRLLGIEIPDSTVVALLNALGMTVSNNGQGWQVVTPSYRSDITIEVDLIEELARLYGLEKIPQQPLAISPTLHTPSDALVPDQYLRQMLVSRGYHETVNYSFVSDRRQQQLDPDVMSIPLANPLSSEMNVMRTSLWPGLLTVLQYNENRQISRVRLFEMGSCFVVVDGRWQQIPKLAGICSGDAHSKQWSEKPRPTDFFDVKGDVAALLTLSHVESLLQFRESKHPALHPGQSAGLYVGARCVGYVGVLHPRWVQEWGFALTPCLFEIDVSALISNHVPRFEPISKFPAIHRDIALVVDQSVPVTTIQYEIQEVAGQLLIIPEIFDIYSGEGIESGKKSVALGLTFQNPNRTLTDQEVNKVIERIVQTLEQKFSAKLRA